MLQNQQNEIPSPFYIPPGVSPPVAAQVHVTPEELTQALSALQASKEQQARQLNGTVSIGQAVNELGLDATPEEIWQQVQVQRMAVQSVRIQPTPYYPSKRGRSQDWAWPIGLGLLMLLLGWGISGSHAKTVISHRAIPAIVSTGGSTIINSDNGDLTYTSHGGEMVINGDNDTVEVQGSCESLTVSGDNEDITVSGSGGTITVNGSNNTIHVDKANTVTTSGDNNTVTCASTSEITTIDNGSNNTITTGTN